MNAFHRNIVSLVLVALACLFPCARADDILLKIDDVPDHGLVVAEVDLTDAAQWCGVDPIDPTTVQARQLPDDTPVPVQFVPGADYHPKTRVAGTLIFRLPAGGSARLRLAFDADGAGDKNARVEKPFDGTVA